MKRGSTRAISRAGRPCTTRRCGAIQVSWRCSSPRARTPRSTSKANKTPADLAGSSGRSSREGRGERAPSTANGAVRGRRAAQATSRARRRAASSRSWRPRAARSLRSSRPRRRDARQSAPRGRGHDVLLQQIQLNMEAEREKKQLERRETRRRLRIRKAAAQETGDSTDKRRQDHRGERAGRPAGVDE